MTSPATFIAAKPVRYLPPKTTFLDSAVWGYRISEIAVAVLMLYVPIAHFPPARALRTRVLDVPTWGAGNERAWTAAPFFVPETVFAFLLAGALIWVRRSSFRATLAPFAPMLAGFALMILGGAVSLGFSTYPGISLAGLAGRLTVFTVALAIPLIGPSDRSARLWTYCALAGTSLMCIVGLIYFLAAFGIPDSLQQLPGFRVSPGIANYQKATYGIASNTDDLLVMTTPIAMALAVSRASTTRTRVLAGSAAVLMALNMTVSFERWAWVCVTIAAIVIAYERAGRRGVALLSGILATAALVVAITSRSGFTMEHYFFEATQPGSGSSFADRMRYWSQGVHALLDHPLGAGLGTAGTLRELPATSSHDLWLDIGIEGGVIALAGALLATWTQVRAFVTALRLRTDDGLSLALMLGVMSFTLYGIFFNSLLYFSGLMVWLAFWWWVPIIAASSGTTAAGPGRRD